MAHKVARMGVFVALCMIFSYIEVLIPFDFGIPGVKLGLANLVIVVGLYLFPPAEVLLISILRIFLTSLLFGNGLSLLYSLSGGILSFAVMLILKKTGWFSIAGVSIAGGVSHNMGQLAVAALILRNLRIFSYLSALLIAGLITGGLIGVISKAVLHAVGSRENGGWENGHQ